MVAPSSTATSKSWLMPMDRWPSIRRSTPRPARSSLSSRSARKYGRAWTGLSTAGGRIISPASLAFASAARSQIVTTSVPTRRAWSPAREIHPIASPADACWRQPLHRDEPRAPPSQRSERRRKRQPFWPCLTEVPTRCQRRADRPSAPSSGGPPVPCFLRSRPVRSQRRP